MASRIRTDASKKLGDEEVTTADSTAAGKGGSPSGASAEATVTRVVAYIVRPGQDTAFRGWLETINIRARRFDGLLTINVVPPPTGATGRDWTVVYRFHNEASFRAWFESRDRRDLLAEAAPLVLDNPVEYTLEAPETVADDRVIVTANAVLPGKEAEYEAADRALNDAAARFPGFVGTRLFKPPAGSNVWSTLVRFNSKANMDRWLASKERAAGREVLYRYVESHHASVVPTGFGSWFAVNASDHIEAPAWKQATIVLAVLFPLVMVLNLTVGAFLTDRHVSFPVNVFIGNALGTVMLTWALMPVVVRLMDWWLSPRASPRNTWLGLALVLLAYIVEIAVFLKLS